MTTQSNPSPKRTRSVVKSIPKVTPLGEDMHIGKLPTQNEYAKARNEFIAEYRTHKDNWLSGSYELDPVLGEAKWNQYYPSGYASWAGQNVTPFNGYGQRRMAEKIDELVATVNKLTTVITAASPDSSQEQGSKNASKVEETGGE